jgi:OTU domain-containing protein 5
LVVCFVKVYGNNVEIQAFAEMYNRPIHIYSYSTGKVCSAFEVVILIFFSIIASVNLTQFAVNAEPINIFQGSYNTDVPPIRLSYHHGNHYNSVVDPRRQAVGAGLGFSSLRGVSLIFSEHFLVFLVVTVISTV